MAIALVFELHGMDIRKSRPREPRLQVGEAARRDIERVEASLRAHQGAKSECLAARAGAKVDHHVTPFRSDEIRHELAALVLNLDRAALEERVMLKRGFSGDAQAQWRIRGRRAIDAI